MTLYDILKAARRKETANADFMTVLRARSSAMYKGVTTVIKTITGSLPLTFNSTGANLAEWSLSGNMSQSGTPTPDNPIYPSECGNLVSDNYVLPIVCGGVTTPVYLGEVQTTRKIKKLVLTGVESTDFYRKNTTSADNSLYYIRFSGLQSVPINGSPLYCTHLPNINDTPSDAVGITVGFNYHVIYFNLGLDVMNAQPSGNTVAGLREYLAAQYAAGTPVTVWYVLATPTTGILNEPIRKIGTYADTISNAATIPTVSGSNTFDVSTTLKPSEATIKYYSADALRQLNITQGSKTKKKSTRKKGT